MGGAAFKCREEDLQGAKLCILSVTCIQGLRWGVQPIKCREEDLQGAKLCILSVTCIQGLRWRVQPSNVERRIYKGPSYAYCQ